MCDSSDRRTKPEADFKQVFPCRKTKQSFGDMKKKLYFIHSLS